MMGALHRWHDYAVFLTNGYVHMHLGPKVTDAEAAHALMTTKASAIISDVEYLGLIQRVKGSQPQLSNLKVLSSAGACLTPIQDPRTITISSDLAPDPNKPSLVILTSGSTGPPKGVAIRRHSVNVAVLGAMTKMGVGVGFNAVQFLPAHHASGLLVNIIPVIVAGGCVELNPGGFDPKRVWDRFCKGGIRTFSAVPTIYVRLVRYWDDNISTMPKEKMAIFKKAVCSIDVFLSGSSALPTHIAQRWTQLTDGNPILERYGSSEGGAIFANSPGSDVTPVSAYLYHFWDNRNNRTFLLIRALSVHLPVVLMFVYRMAMKGRYCYEVHYCSESMFSFVREEAL